MRRSKWVERTFQSVDDNGLLPGIIERLEGTPVRLEAKISKMPETLLSQRSGDKWSVKKEVGHLNDLEALWLARVIQIQTGLAEMIAADMSNQKTHSANHDERMIEDLLSDFKVSREQLVTKLKSLNEEDLGKSSFHPRLQIPMKIVELAYFVAEHDDHHLAQLTELLEAQTED